MQSNSALSRFATSAVPTIPERSLAKYVTASPAAQAIDAPPRTSAAHQAEAPMIASAANSSRAQDAVWGWTHDPALLVGVGVCFVVWLASTKLMRR